MDDEILKTVESMLGTNVKIVDCEKTSTVCEEEILLVNGVPIQLETADDLAIKRALITGEVPSCDLLNQLLFRAGILRQPVHLETSLSVKTTLITKEDVQIARAGQILDEKSTETKEDNFYTSSSREIWEPVRMVARASIPTINHHQSTTMPSKSTVNVTGQVPGRQNSSVSTTDSSSASSSAADVHSTCSTSSSSSSRPASCASSSGEAVGPQPHVQSATTVRLPSSSSAAASSVFSDSKWSTPTISQLYDKLQPPPPLTTTTPNNNCSISCDSGHEDVFSSSFGDHSNLLAATPNSVVSSCFDFSFDEADFVKTTTTTTVAPPPPSDVRGRPQQPMVRVCVCGARLRLFFLLFSPRASKPNDRTTRRNTTLTVNQFSLSVS